MTYSIIDTGNSRSFPTDHPLLKGKSSDGNVVLIIGEKAGELLSTLSNADSKAAIMIELGNECLGVHTGESRATEGFNILGFVRFRLGDSDPSNLVELVRQPDTSDAAISAAKAVLEGAGLKVAVCFDFSGRIIDRLVRPYYNAVLRRLDESLATADDMDLTLKLGLGYPEGPIALLERTGLAHHFDVTQALFEAYGESPYAPARRARVAKSRAQKKVA
ncbi:3-hydroxyacyl-CoA dehydrogenase family protein [Glaciimonas immobilis]|uniref:3-hydroxybutyryl-CoA dehydrogenase n=1 Tax=Glaciimonas immobilis TaxID=728004 RepID=A0A840RTK7_9BURK|nr:3-hydroxyacyl-CoA dehydrogenase family protein [Glaciimonas immobilis]KAF3997077.1 3-hydroxyacyl-CoA dehydrogenase [Glaciimonas immobilis]MBB5199931.1 3-hydroxybutyryl-CoA dehydrogenase [Glaciimonas immobilis]